MKKRRPNYRRVGDTYLIELKLDNLQQLFNVLDPAPFRDKDLAPAAEEYIVDAAAEFSMDTQLKLMLHLPGTAYDEEHTTGVPQAIRNYFAYRTAVMARQFKEVLAQGRKSLVIGVGFLSFCLLGHHVIAALGKSGLFWSVLEEGFLITGWVAMWHPIDLFLYKWWPVRRRQHLMEKLAQIEVEMKRRETA